MQKVKLNNGVERGIIAIPKSVHRERILENLTVFDFELAQEDIDHITSLDTKTIAFFDHRDPEIVKRIGTRQLDI